MSKLDITLPPAHKACAAEGGDWLCRRIGEQRQTVQMLLNVSNVL